MLIGNIGSTRRAEVGAGGRLALSGGVTIEWWVRSGDRWHVPALDVTSRDWMLDNAPVLRTAIRVPGGDATGTVYATVQGPREVVAVEVTNASPAPLALGLVVRSGSGRVIRLDGTTVFDGDRPVLYLSGAPADVVAGPLAPLVADSSVNRQEVGVDPKQALAETASTEALFVLPILHKSTVRVAALLGVSSALGTASTPVLSALPDAAMVARGWGLQANDAPRVEGDQPRANRIRALATALLLQVDGAEDRPLTDRAALARALVRIGAHDEAIRIMPDLDELQARNGSLGGTVRSTAELALAGITLGRHLPDVVYGTSIVPMLAGALEYVHKGRKSDPDVVRAHSGLFLAASRLFERVDEQRAAKAAAKVWQALGGEWPVAFASEPVQPASSLGASLVPADAPRLANASMAAIDALATEDSAGAIELFTGWSAAELAGRPVAVHGVDTVLGRMSVAIRWHGARPALLWEVACAPADPLVLRCSVLDPSWSTTKAVGEGLLAAPSISPEP
jgi:hypothetical protein